VRSVAARIALVVEELPDRPIDLISRRPDKNFASMSAGGAPARAGILLKRKVEA
jgi:hypothetical protein